MTNLADDADAGSRARAGFSWATRRNLPLMRKQLSHLSEAHLNEAIEAACIFISAASQIADERMFTVPDSPAELVLPKRAEAPCGYCGRTDCADRWQCEREDRGHEVTWWKAAKP